MATGKAAPHYSLQFALGYSRARDSKVSADGFVRRPWSAAAGVFRRWDQEVKD